MPPSAADEQPGGLDPAERIVAAHVTAEALVAHGRAGDDERRARLIALADETGIDEMAELWADRPADSLPGALYRLYALRDAIRRDPLGMARAFDEGRSHAPVHEVIAGVGQPPGPQELIAMADAVLGGAFAADLGDALNRAAAFCRVVATGWAVLADSLDDAASADEPTSPATSAGPASAAVPAKAEGRGNKTATAALLSPGEGLTRLALELQRVGVALENAAAAWRAGRLN